MLAVSHDRLRNFAVEPIGYLSSGSGFLAGAFQHFAGNPAQGSHWRRAFLAVRCGRHFQPERVPERFIALLAT